MQALPVGDCVWEIPPGEKPGMLVPARIYASAALLGRMDQGVFEHDDSMLEISFKEGNHAKSVLR